MAAGRRASGAGPHDRRGGDGGRDAVARQFEREYPQSNQATAYFLMPLRDALVGSTKGALVLLLAAVAVVLLIACVNVANLLLARVARRAGARWRCAWRSAPAGGGSSRSSSPRASCSRLVAGALGIALAYWGAKGLVALVPRLGGAPDADRRAASTASVLGFTLLLAVATALGFGAVAALTLRLENALGTRWSSPAGPRSSAMARRAMGGLVIARDRVRRRAADRRRPHPPHLRRPARGGPRVQLRPGADDADLALPADRYAAIEARAGLLRSRLRRAPRAARACGRSVTGVVMPLTGNNWTVPLERTDQPVPPGERPPDVGWQLASAGFFRALEIPLRRRAAVRRARRAHGSPPVVIVSEAVQRRYFAGECTRSGKTLKLGEQTPEIVGVVGDIRRAGLERRAPGRHVLPVRAGARPARSRSSSAPPAIRGAALGAMQAAIRGDRAQRPRWPETRRWPTWRASRCGSPGWCSGCSATFAADRAGARGGRDLRRDVVRGAASARARSAPGSRSGACGRTSSGW